MATLPSPVMSRNIVIIVALVAAVGATFAALLSFVFSAQSTTVAVGNRLRQLSDRTIGGELRFESVDVTANIVEMIRPMISMSDGTLTLASSRASLSLEQHATASAIRLEWIALSEPTLTLASSAAWPRAAADLWRSCRRALEIQPGQSSAPMVSFDGLSVLYKSAASDDPLILLDDVTFVLQRARGGESGRPSLDIGLTRAEHGLTVHRDTDSDSATFNFDWSIDEYTIPTLPEGVLAVVIAFDLRGKLAAQGRMTINGECPSMTGSASIHSARIALAGHVAQAEKCEFTFSIACDPLADSPPAGNHVQVRLATDGVDFRITMHGAAGGGRSCNGRLMWDGSLDAVLSGDGLPTRRITGSLHHPVIQEPP